MSTERYYDAIILGAERTGLLCACLLARRGLRVLVMEQGTPKPTYHACGLTWPKRIPNLHISGSPNARRVLEELALGPNYRRSTQQHETRFQYIAKETRFEFAMDARARSREFEREFPSLKRIADDLYRTSERLNQDLDRLFESEVRIPAETFLERHALHRSLTHRLFSREGDAADPFGELPHHHTFAKLVDATIAFSSYADPAHLSPLARARLHHSWTRGLVDVQQPGWLEEALRAELIASNGELRSDARVGEIHVRRGAAHAVQIAQSDEVIGAGCVICAQAIDSLLPLLPDRSALRDVFERYGEPVVRYFRYTLNLWIREEGIPSALCSDALLSLSPLSQDIQHLRLHRASEGERGLRRITVEALLTRRAVEGVPRYVERLRERIIDELQQQIFHYLDHHLVLSDSPHDGRGIEEHSPSGASTLHAPPEPWERGPQTMPTIHGYPVSGDLGVAGMPLRTPIRRLYLCSQQNLPGLGDEGLFVSARAVADLVVKIDGRRAKRLRQPRARLRPESA